MLSDFTFLYGNNLKVEEAFGKTTGQLQLKNAKKIFGKGGQVFFEITKSDFGKLGSINMENYPYALSYAQEASQHTIYNDIEILNTIRYYAIDINYILNITRAFTTLDFSNFTGEAYRILHAWMFVSSHGDSSIEPGSIVVLSHLNEYGEKARPRSMSRNLKKVTINGSDLVSYKYATSTDKEWTLTPDDYSKVAALDNIFKLLSTSDYDDKDNLSSIYGLIYDMDSYINGAPTYLAELMEKRDKIIKENN